MKPAHQLLVIWEKGRSQEAAILDLIDADPAFEVVGTVEVTWPSDCFSNALGQLYGERLASRSEKQRHCGTGTFLVVIVRDLDPRPGLRRTPRGCERVDTHMFDLKQTARRLTGGGHRVHATDGGDEFRRDLVVLTGMTEADLIDRGDFGHETRAAPPDGAGGWSCVEAMLEGLQRRMPYCVLRNFETWDGSGPIDDHPDIDLLVASPSEAANVLAAAPTSRRRGRVQHRVRIGERMVEIDLRSPGDGYFPTGMAERALHGAVDCPAGFKVPSPRDHLDTLLYHALVHRPTLTDDYTRRLGQLAGAAGVALGDLEDQAVQCRLVHKLSDAPPLPRDPSVKFNDRLLGAPTGLRRRRAVQRVRSVGGRGLRRLGAAS